MKINKRTQWSKREYKDLLENSKIYYKKIRSSIRVLKDPQDNSKIFKSQESRICKKIQYISKGFLKNQKKKINKTENLPKKKLWENEITWQMQQQNLDHMRGRGRTRVE